MPMKKVGDINMYYEIHGDGEPLLLLMGLGGGSSMWWQQVTAFSHSYRVVTFDSRGVGRTDKPDAAYTMEMLVYDALGLLSSLGMASAHVYGLSMGGMIAQELALRHPNSVVSLVLGATSCGGVHSLPAPQEVINELLNILSLPPQEAARVSAALTFSDSFVDNHPNLIHEWMMKGAASPPSRQGFKKQAEAIASFDTYDRLPQIRIPTLVIAGTLDKILPAENSRILASRIPNAELVLLEGAGHGYLWEAADEADRVVLDFLKRHRKTPASTATSLMSRSYPESTSSEG